MKPSNTTIDARFFPSPKKILVPLYPPVSPRVGKKPSLIEKFIASHYGSEEENIFLSKRGSTALLVFLKWLSYQYDSSRKIALPAFCCPALCHAILASGFDPVFLDLTESLTISCKSIEYAVSQGCRALVWPQLFQERSLPIKTIEKIKEKKLLLINDEAQVFPRSSRNEKNHAASISIFSFGPSKRLAASGGGGICIHDTTININEMKKTSLQLTSTNIFKNIFRKLKDYRHLTRKMEKRLNIYLEKYPFTIREMLYAPISCYQKCIVQQHIEQYYPHQNQFQSDFFYLKSRFPSPYLGLIDNNPSTLALQVPSNDRYAISTRLADLGIQTTWYFFPLNRLTFLQAYSSEETPNTDRLSSEILILPFQWRHSASQRKELFDALRKVIRVTR